MNRSLAWMVLLAWSGVVTIAFGKGASHSVQVASTTVVVPTAANVVGATGSTFRTRISIFNPSFSQASYCALDMRPLVPTS